jgi:hypothetical protein
LPADTAYLTGGPCAGKTQKISAAESDSGTIICKGGLYQNADTVRGNGDIVFKYAGAASTGGGGTSQTIKAPQALRGWKALRKSLNKGYPTTLAFMQHGNQDALRSLHQTRKVRL